MSFTIAGNIQTVPTKLTATTVTTIFTATKRTTIVSIIATEIAGSTPALTLELYNGTTSYYLRKSKAMTAGETFILDAPFVLAANWSLRATASAANQIDIFVNHLTSDATALGNQFTPLGQR